MLIEEGMLNYYIHNHKSLTDFWCYREKHKRKTRFFYYVLILTWLFCCTSLHEFYSQKKVTPFLLKRKLSVNARQLADQDSKPRFMKPSKSVWVY